MMLDTVFNLPVGSLDTWFYISGFIPKGSWHSFIFTCKVFLLFNSSNEKAKRHNKLCAYLHLLDDQERPAFENWCVRGLNGSIMENACIHFRDLIVSRNSLQEWAYSHYVTLSELKEMVYSRIDEFLNCSPSDSIECLDNIDDVEYIIEHNKGIDFKDLLNAFGPSTLTKLFPNDTPRFSTIRHSIGSSLMRREDFDCELVRRDEFKDISLGHLSRTCRLNQEWLAAAGQENTEVFINNKHIVWDDLNYIPSFRDGKSTLRLNKAVWVNDEVILKHPEYPWAKDEEGQPILKGRRNRRLIEHFKSLKGNTELIYEECLRIEGIKDIAESYYWSSIWVYIVLKNGLVPFEEALKLSTNKGLKAFSLIKHPDFDLSVVCKSWTREEIERYLTYLLTCLDRYPDTKVSNWDLVIPCIPPMMLGNLSSLNSLSKEHVLKYSKAGWNFDYLLLYNKSLSAKDLIELVRVGALKY